MNRRRAVKLLAVSWLTLDALVCIAFHAYRAHLADDWMALANAVQDDPIDTEYARLCREAGQA